MIDSMIGGTNSRDGALRRKSGSLYPRARLILATTALVSMLPQGTLADEYDWAGTTNAGFINASNWLTGAPPAVPATAPGAADTVVIGTSTPNLTQINTGNAVTVTSVLVNGTGNLFIATGGSLDAATGGVTISGTGNLTIDGGSLTGDVTNSSTVVANGTLTGAVDNSGTFTLSGALTGVTTLTNAGLLNGGAANSVAVVDYEQTAGSLSTVVNATGTVTLSGGTIAAAGTIDGGGTAATTINGSITNNGAIQNMDSLTLASGTVTGGGTTSTVDYIQTGGVLDVVATATGTSALSGGTISGTLHGGVITSTGTVGNSGTIDGTSLAVSGGTLTNSGTIGTAVTVAGAGTLTTTGSSTVGINNAGTVNASGTVSGATVNSGTFNLTGATTANSSFGNTGTLNTETSALTGVTTLTNAGTISGTGSVAATTFNQTAGSLAATVTAGTSALSGGTISGTLHGGVIASTGTVGNSGTIDGTSLAVSGGTLTNSGTIGTAVTVAGAGTLTTTGSSTVSINNAGIVNASGTVSGATVNSGTFNLTGATTANSSFGNTGTLNTETSALTGVTTLTNAGTISGTGSVAATTFNQTAGSLAATVTAGTSALSGGTISGTVSGAGTGTAEINGAVVNNGSIDDMTSLTLSSGTLSGTGTASTVDYTQTGGILASTVTATGAIALSGGSISGAGVLDGDNSGAATISGSYANAGTIQALSSLTLSGGTFSGAGTAATVAYNQTGGSLATTVNASGASTLSGGTIDVGGVLNGTTTTISGAVTNNGTLDGATTVASGILTLGAGSATTGTLTSAATITTAGDVTIAADVTSNGGTFDLSDGSALTLSNTLTLTGASTITMLDRGQTAVEVGTLAGTGTIGFNLLADFQSQDLGEANKLSLLHAANGMAQDKFVTAAISSGAKIRLYVADAGTGELYTYLTSNPAIEELAGNVTLTEQLLSSLINRPVSPFSLVADTSTGDACRSAGYARAVLGKATVEGDSSTGALAGKVEGNYTSAQVSGDYGCYDGRFGGWSAVFGVTAGSNQGSTDQQEFSIDGFGNKLAANGVLTTDFTQTYAGIYASGRKEKLSADVQLRYSKADYEFSESSPAIFGAGADTTMSTEAISLNTRLQYNIRLENSWSVTPSGGFSITHVKGDKIAFDATSSLEVGDYDSLVAFGGATFTKALAETAGGAGQAVSIGANYYHDFQGDRTSIFTADGASSTINSPSLGGFGELSVGYTMTKSVADVLGKDALMFFKVEGSVRSGEHVPSASSITAQFRIVF